MFLLLASLCAAAAREKLQSGGSFTSVHELGPEDFVKVTAVSACAKLSANGCCCNGPR